MEGALFVSATCNDGFPIVGKSHVADVPPFLPSYREGAQESAGGNVPKIDIAGHPLAHREDSAIPCYSQFRIVAETARPFVVFMRFVDDPYTQAMAVAEDDRPRIR